MGARYQIDFSESEHLLEEVAKLGGNVEKVAEKALDESHDYITPKIETNIQNANLPAHGKYAKSGEHLRNQLIKDKSKEWEGKTCAIDVGFRIDKQPPVPIFMIRGTSKMKPVKGLKQTLEGSKTQEEVANIQEDVLIEEITRIYGA